MKNNYLYISPSRVDEIIKFLPTDKSFMLIEYGPGSGNTLIEIKDKFPKSMVHGFDIYPIETMNKKIKIDCLDIEDNTNLMRFKKLISKSNYHLFNDVIEHLKDPFKFFDHFQKIINKNSILIISCPNFASIRFLSAWINADFPKTNSGFFDKTHLHWFTKKELEKYFYSQNFEIIGSNFIFSKKNIYKYFQLIWPLRLCSQFQIIIKRL